MANPFGDVAAAVAATGVSANKVGRVLYVAAGEAVVGAGVAGRTTMLPPGTTGSSLTVPGGMLTVGGELRIRGTGLIGAMSVGPGTFSLIPHVTPAGGSKTDLPGFSYAPLLGADGTCTINLGFAQTASGLLVSGVVTYGLANGMHYTITLNAGTTSTQPVTIASDPSVDRVFGVDGQWATTSAANYVRSRQVTATLIMPA